MAEKKIYTWETYDELVLDLVDSGFGSQWACVEK